MVRRLPGFGSVAGALLPTGALQDESETGAQQPQVLGQGQALRCGGQASGLAHPGGAQVEAEQAGGERAQPGPGELVRDEGQ